MGLTIHYNGRFNPAASLKEMIEEVKDIATIYKWNYHVFKEQFPVHSLGLESFTQEIFGINFTPPKCETVSLSFLSNGRMCSPVSLKLYGEPADETEAAYLYMLFTKTQYAGIEIHKLLVHLLKHVSQKYLLEFNVIDEGEYWETGNEKLLKEIFDRYNLFTDIFATSLETFPKNPNESFEAYFEKLLHYIQQKAKGN